MNTVLQKQRLPRRNAAGTSNSLFSIRPNVAGSHHLVGLPTERVSNTETEWKWFVCESCFLIYFCGYVCIMTLVLLLQAFDLGVV